MAARKQLFHPAEVKKNKEPYVYRIFDGQTTVYVGKGSGRRLHVQQRNFGLEGEIIEYCADDDHAFERERHWISELMPTDNKSPGGNGGRTTEAIPKILKGIYTLPQWKSLLRQEERQMKEMERVGSQKYTAQWLMSRLNEDNCEQFGVSKVGLSRIAEVANG